MVMSIATSSLGNTGRKNRPDLDAWRETIWMGMRMLTPADWEILRHGLGREKGRLVFVDRRRQRLQVSWARMDRPDLSRAMSDYQHLDRQQEEIRHFHAIGDLHDWTGFHRRGLTRLARWDADRRLTIEMAIAWPGQRDAAVESAIAEEFSIGLPPPPRELAKDEKPPAHPSRWRAFGLDATAPAGWTLSGADVRPADTTFRFHDLHDPTRRVHVRRVGMVAAWFDGSLEAFVRKSVGVGPEIRHQATTCGTRPALRSECVEKSTRFQRLARRAPVRRDLTWHEPASHAVLNVTSWSVGEKNAVDPMIFTVQGYSTA